VELSPDDTIVSVGAGGGGYGPPHERDEWRVKKDVDEGWVTRERAEQVYGVAFTADGQVDGPATRALRARLAKNLSKV
jgi:N-methylhydantoinase B